MDGIIILQLFKRDEILTHKYYLCTYVLWLGNDLQLTNCFESHFFHHQINSKHWFWKQILKRNQCLDIRKVRTVDFKNLECTFDCASVSLLPLLQLFILNERKLCTYMYVYYIFYKYAWQQKSINTGMV